MNRLAICLSILLTFGAHLTGYCQTGSNDTKPLTHQQINSLAILGKIWGFLKYYHPHVAAGQYDWDSVLLARLPQFLAAGDSNTLNNRLLEWLSELGPVDPCRNCENNLPDTVILRADTSWLHTSGFSSSLVSRLTWILHNRYQGPGYYAGYAGRVKIKNEKSYNTPDFLYPPAGDRLLLLFRYWNIVNYFSPYMRLTDIPWPEVMEEFIPLFYNARDTLDYHLLVMRLFATLDDGHTAFVWTDCLRRYFGDYAYVPFQCMLIDGKAVVTRVYNDSLCREDGIRPGDVIVKVDHELVSEKLNKDRPYLCSGSNEDGRLFSFCESMLFRGKDSVAEIELSAGQKPRQIRRYTNTSDIFGSTGQGGERDAHFRMLKGRIMYVDMGHLSIAEIDSLKRAAWNTKAIIFDLRNYPNNTWRPLAEWLADKPFYLGKICYPVIGYPGAFHFENDGPFPAANNGKYRGKIVILVDAATKSHGEYSVMGLQAAVKTITIGSRTAGADGDITDWIAFPGGFRTRFSGLGIYYPDGTCAQRKGVKIDIVVQPSISGIRQGKDEILEKAIHLVEARGPFIINPGPGQTQQ